MDSFEQWRAKYVNPHDTGKDYDLRGAWQAGIIPGPDKHFPDTFKLPNHPYFSIESKYWYPGLPAGRWDKDNAGQDIYIWMDAETAAQWVKEHPIGK